MKTNFAIIMGYFRQTLRRGEDRRGQHCFFSLRGLFFWGTLVLAVTLGAPAIADIEVSVRTPLPSPFLATGQMDPIASRGFRYQAADPGRVLDLTTAKLKSVFQRYRPALDSGTSVIKPLVISGSETQPRLQMTLKKCVLFICETVSLDAVVSLRETRGSCTRNFVITADLTRSSELLAKNYRALRVNICAQLADASADLQIDAFAERGAGYESGTVTQEIFKLLSAQIPPMTNALTESLRANGAR